MVASSTLQLGLALLQAGEREPARARLEECLPLLRQQRAWKWAIVALIGTGVIASRAGAAAAAAYAEALGLCRDTGSSAGDLAACLEGVAAAAAAAGQTERAAPFLGAADVAREAALASTMPGFEERYGVTERAVRAALGAEAFAARYADWRFGPRPPFPTAVVALRPRRSDHARWVRRAVPRRGGAGTRRREQHGRLH